MSYHYVKYSNCGRQILKNLQPAIDKYTSSYLNYDIYAADILNKARSPESFIVKKINLTCWKVVRFPENKSAWPTYPMNRNITLKISRIG